MSDIFLRRHWYSLKSTIGVLALDDFSCFTLEDVARADSVKIAKETAIPAGRYRVIVSRSERFSRKASEKAGHPVDIWLPELLNVPMFTGIRIHAANKAEDLEGCIAVGCSRAPDWIGGSKLALADLVTRIEAVLPGLWVTITNEQVRSGV